jgi:hypothetical protein
MSAAYLDTTDLERLGVGDATLDQIGTASRTIDSFIDRPEGLIWIPGADGMPAYMAGLTPRLTLHLGAGIAAGSNITVPVANASMVMPGEVLVIDRGVTGKTETLIVADISATSSTLTFQTVAMSHASGAVLDAGLVLEETGTPNRMGVVRLPARPVARVISAAAASPRGSATFYQANASGPNQAQIVAPFASLLFDDMRALDRREVTIRYLAGFTLATLPEAVRQAAAAILKAVLDSPEMLGNVKVLTAGGTKIERWSPSVIDADTRRLLGPFMNSAASFR